MSSSDQLVKRLEDLSADVCSDKVTIRNKAIDQVKQILDSSTTTIQAILSGSTASSITPKYVFSNIFNGLLKHATRQEQTQTQRADNKAAVFITITQYLIDNCNQLEANRIPSSLIFDSILSIFEDSFYARQYGLQFLNILAMYLSVPNHSNFFNVDKALWRRLLDGCRQMCEHGGEGQRNYAIQCIAMVLELGSLYSYLPDVVVDFVPFVESLFADAGKANDVLRICFLLTKNLCVSYQYEMCLFSENVCHSVLKSYNTNMKEDLKTLVFEYLHLVMLIHEPRFTHTSTHYKRSEWTALKCSIGSVVEAEIKYLNEHKFSRDIDVLPDAICSCASYLFYLRLKQPSNDKVEVLEISDEEQEDVSPRLEKRTRTSSEFEQLLNRIRPNDKKFVWRWFVILGSALHQRPFLTVPHNEISALVHLCSQCIEEMSYERQFKALYRICLFLLEAYHGETVNWEAITRGAFKLAAKYQSAHSLELLQFSVANSLCSPQLVLEIYSAIITVPMNEPNLRTLCLLYQLEGFSEIAGEELLESGQIVQYLNSNGGLVLSRQCFTCAIEWICVCLNIPRAENGEPSCPIKSLELTTFEVDIEKTSKAIHIKSLKMPEEEAKEKKKEQMHSCRIKPSEINKSLIRKLFRSIFAEAAESQHISGVVKLMLRQVEFTARFLQHIGTAVDMAAAGTLTDDILVRLEGSLKGLAKAFQSQLSEDNEVINQILEFLSSFLSVDYVKNLKPVLVSTGFLLQSAIWAHHQFLSEENRDALIAQPREEGIGSVKAISKRNSLVIEIILRLGSIQESVFKDYWFEGDLNSATDVIASFQILKKVSRMSANPSIVKLVIGELEDIFTVHHKNEKISHLVLETLTEFLGIFKDHPTTINDWDRFVKKYILWGCKQKYSPMLTLQLLEFYDRFFENFSEHRDLNPELRDYIAESLSMFIRSKNLAIQLRTVQVLVKICSINHLMQKKSLTNTFEYCRFVIEIVVKQPWKDLLDVEDCGESTGRMVAKDEQQNHQAIMHHLVCGIAPENELLAGFLLNHFVKFFHRNRSLKRDSASLSIASLVKQHMVYLSGAFLNRDINIEMFPFFLSHCKSIECFVRHFQVEIGMNFIRCRPWKEFDELCQKYNLNSAKDLMMDRFIVYRLIPMHDLFKNVNFKRNLEYLLGQEDIPLNELPAKDYFAILRGLFDSFRDDKGFLELFNFPLAGVELTKDNFAIDQDQYEEILMELNSRAVKNKEPFIVNLCMKHPYSILLLLSHLQENIQSAEFLLQKLRNLHKIIQFHGLLLKFIARAADNEQIDNYKAYFVKDMVLFLLTVTCKDQVIPTSVKVPLLRHVLEMIKRTVVDCCQMYKENLNHMVSLLVGIPIDQGQLVLGETVAELLKFFFVDSRQLFGDILDRIDIIPVNTPFLQGVSTIQMGYAKGTVAEEIERFLAVPKRSVHSLKYLRQKIGEQEDKFIALFQGLKQGLRNVPNSENLTHKLVLALLRCVQQEDEEIRVEASKILGDLGPVDLNTMVLNNSGHKIEFTKVFQSESACVTYFLPEIIAGLQDLQYEYTPHVSASVLNALAVQLRYTEASGLLQSRKDLNLFRQVISGSESTLASSAHEISELELFAGFTVNQFSRATFDEWVQGNVKKLLRFFKRDCLYSVVEKTPSFGKRLFPFLISLVLAAKNDRVKHAMEETFNNFFRDFETARAIPTRQSSSLMLNESLLKLMLDSVEIIRIFNQNSPVQLNLNYLSIAAAAQHCHLEANAILYSELWVEQEKQTRKCSENDLPLGELRAIIIPSYEALEVPDAVKPFLDLNNSRHKYYTLENAWEFAYLETTAGLNARKINRRESTNQSIRFAQSTETSADYEVIWRMGDWDQLRSIAIEGGAVDYQKSHCLALKNLHCGREFQSKLFLRMARDQVMDTISRSSLDCTKGAYQSLTALKQIQQLEDVLQETRNWRMIVDKWLRFDALQTNSFDQQEQILVQRIAILQSKSGQRAVPSLVERQMRGTILDLIRLAKDDRNFRAAVTNLKRLDGMELETEIKSRMVLEDGHLQFIAGHSKLANHLYLRLINEEEFRDTFSRISALLLMAEYLTDNLMVSPNEILQMYLLPAEKLYMSYSKAGGRLDGLHAERVKIYLTTAKFADTIYTQRSNYMRSSEYAEKQRLHDESRAEFNAIDRKTLMADDAAKLRVLSLKQTIVLEESQLKTVKEEREQYLHLAIKMYTKSCVMNGDLHDLQICRIVSLWFTNIGDSFTGQFLQKNLPDIPSYKFLMILPQVAARLSHSDQTLTRTISEVLVRCCREHPHHAIYHVLALHNAHEDNKRAEISSSMETRINNTGQIMRQLEGDHAIRKIVAAAQNLGIALIRLANRPVQDANDSKVGAELMNLRDMHRIGAPTADLQVLLGREYATFPHIVSWVPRFQMVGGINCPKKLTFLCSDGVSRSMLVKGKDDMRQDAVMQQVFHFMNVLLRNKKSSCKRNLSIRTYKIVPLTQMSGVLEFCDNTNTLGNYLVAAHQKYRPGEPKVSECRQFMTEVAKKPAEEKLKQFQNICNRLSPVFQHFFTENFFSAVEWFEKRMFYVNSVATTSMVGYIMGIGDRHVNNILIDKATAEVIHIDFGIALEKGKLLPTPERVPFRLTRDLVAAMGCFGVDGLFRTSCEITMQVLRENKALINTIVEVFLYDPLSSWFSGKRKVSKQQQDEEKNALAARVLIRLNEKLNGRDENDTTAIENQVERLIRQATSPTNLSQMFYGWQPYL